MPQLLAPPAPQVVFKEATVGCAVLRKQQQPTDRQVGTLVQLDFVGPSLVKNQGWSRVPAPGLVLSLGAKVDSKQTPSQGKASSDRFDPGSFFLPCFWKGGLGEGNDVAQLRIGVGLGGALLPPHGRRRARSLDDGILVKLRGRSWVCHPGVTRPRLGPPVKPRDQRYRTRHSVRRSSQG